MAYPYQQGMLLTPGPGEFHYRGPALGSCMSMRWFGGLGHRSAYLCVAEPPDDARLQLDYRSTRGLDVSYQWLHSLGTLRYTRVLKYRFTDRPSYVRLAELFREYAEACGLVVPLREKIDACPPLSRLEGGMLLMMGYYRDHGTDYTAQLKCIRGMGIDRALVYPTVLQGWSRRLATKGPDRLVFSKPELRAVKRLGYLTGAFITPLEISSTHALAEGLARVDNPAKPAAKRTAWKIDDYVSWRVHFGKALQHFDRRFSFPDIEDIHFDVLGNAPGLCEDYSGDWPCTRTENLHQSVDMVRHFLRQGKIVSCESKTDSLAPYIHWGSNRIRVVPQYTCEPPFEQRSFIHPIPLWHLVFHDCMFHTSWDHATYNDGCHFGPGDPVVGYLHDMLYGDLPSVFAMGRIYHYPFRRPNRPPPTNPKKATYYSINFNSRKVQRALRLAKQAADFHREVGCLRMVSHRIMPGAPLVQESLFENGRRVVVNFSEEQVEVEGMSLAGRDAVVQ